MTELSSFSMVAKEYGVLNENDKLYRTFDISGLRENLNKIKPMIDNPNNVVLRQATFAKSTTLIDQTLMSFSVPQELLNSTEMKPLYDACNIYHPVRKTKAYLIAHRNSVYRLNIKRDAIDKRAQGMSEEEHNDDPSVINYLDSAILETEAAMAEYTTLVEHELRYLQFRDALKRSLDLNNLMIDTLKRIFPGVLNEIQNVHPPNAFMSNIKLPDVSILFNPPPSTDYEGAASSLMNVLATNTEIYHRPFSDWTQLAEFNKILFHRYANVERSDLVAFRNSLFDGQSYKMAEEHKVSEWVHLILIPTFEAIKVSKVQDIQLTDENKMHIFQVNTASIDRFKSLNQKWSAWLNNNLTEPKPTTFNFDTQIRQHESIDNWHWSNTKLQPKLIDVEETHAAMYSRDGIKEKIKAFQPIPPRDNPPSDKPLTSDAVRCKFCNRAGHVWRDCRTAKRHFDTSAGKSNTGSSKDYKYSSEPPHESDKKLDEPKSAMKKTKFATSQIEYHCNELLSAEEASSMMTTSTAPHHQSIERWIADSGSMAFIAPNTDNLTNLKPSDRMFMGISGQCNAVEHTGTLFNLENIAVSSQAKRALCSTLLLAKESNMLSVVCDIGTIILKPGAKVSIKRDDILVTAMEIDGLHRLTQKQMNTVATSAPKK